MSDTITDTPEIILRDDPRAATLVTAPAWRSRTGRLFVFDPESQEQTPDVAESMARYEGSTHSRCDCGALARKPWSACPDCIGKRKDAEHAARPTAPWDGVCMLYSDRHDRYFQDFDELEEWAGEEGIPLESARILLCEPNHARLAPSHFEDLFPDDRDECPDDLWGAIEAFNQRVASLVLSWDPGRTALDIEATLTAIASFDAGEGFAAALATAPEPTAPALPAVAGRRASTSNADFERACLVHIARLQDSLGPYDSAMLATFCEAVRMVREYSDAMQQRKAPVP